MIPSTDFEKYADIFFWDYTRKDNVVYNFKCLETLCILNISSDLKRYVCKPIIILLASILECVFFDFLTRTQGHTKEKIPNVSAEDVASIKNTELPRSFLNFSELMKKYEFLGEENLSIYSELRNLVNVRNRIHIQNLKKNEPIHEDNLWDISLVKHFGKLFKEIFLHICKNYPRAQAWGKPYEVLPDFPEPWNTL